MSIMKPTNPTHYVEHCSFHICPWKLFSFFYTKELWLIDSCLLSIPVHWKFFLLPYDLSLPTVFISRFLLYFQKVFFKFLLTILFFFNWCFLYRLFVWSYILLKLTVWDPQHKHAYIWHMSQILIARNVFSYYMDRKLKAMKANINHLSNSTELLNNNKHWWLNYYTYIILRSCVQYHVHIVFMRFDLWHMNC